MRKITYTNARGESIELYLSPFLITKLEGIGEVDAETQTSKAPYQDGVEYVDTLLQPRIITVEGEFTETDSVTVRQRRALMQRVCNPKLGLGTVRLELDGVVKEIQATLDGSPAFPDKQREIFQKFLIHFYCPDPYWKDLNQVSKALQSYVGNFMLPITLPFELGMSGDYTILNNAGDVPAPVVIDISGPTTNPKITNTTTGEFIRINRSIAANEIVQIDTSPNHKRVEIIRDGQTIANAFGYLDHTSTLFKLTPGDNQIEYIADAGDADAIVAIAWQNQYVGV